MNNCLHSVSVGPVRFGGLRDGERGQGYRLQNRADGLPVDEGPVDAIATCGGSATP